MKSVWQQGLFFALLLSDYLTNHQPTLYFGNAIEGVMISREYIAVVLLSLISFAVGALFLYFAFQTLKGVWLIPTFFCTAMSFAFAIGSRRIYLRDNYVRKEDLVDSEEQIED